MKTYRMEISVKTRMRVDSNSQLIEMMINIRSALKTPRESKVTARDYVTAKTSTQILKMTGSKTLI